MKCFSNTLLLVLVLVTACLAADRVEAPADCKQCGMNRTTFAQSRMLITYADGSSSGTCSINCTVVEGMARKGQQVTAYQVGDYDSRKLIDARSAVWVIGGKKRGVMSPVAKWAFADKKGAEKFTKEFRGKLATFAEVVKATEQELAEGEKHDSPSHGDHKGHKH